MDEMRDSIHHAQLARKARQLAETYADPDVKRRLREAANKHDRTARRLARLEAKLKIPRKRGLGQFFE